MRNRNLSLDIIRILACCMIVLMHSPIPSENANGPFLTALSYFTAPGIGLFFMVSGALLMPVRTDYFRFIKRRLAKIVIPTIIWTGVYLVLNLYYSESEINVLQSLLSIPFSAQGHGVLWFMYTLTGLYLIAPILSAWLEKATVKEIEFALLIWCVSLCYPLLESGLLINFGTTGILYYFTGYAGYFLLGYYLNNYPKRLSTLIPGAIAALSLILLIFLKWQKIEFDFYRLFWYESILTAAQSCLIWMVAIKFSKRFTANKQLPALVQISNICFGIYLMHILVMRYWLWESSWIQGIDNYILQTFVIAILTFILTSLFCLVLSKTTVASWIIGYKRQK